MRFLLAFVLMAGAKNITHAQVIYVKVQPVDPVVVRPVQPSPAHVWVDGEYVVHNGAYVWQAGYWTIPPAGRTVWIRGHWVSGPSGYYWKPGHWR